MSDTNITININGADISASKIAEMIRKEPANIKSPYSIALEDALKECEGEITKDPYSPALFDALKAKLKDAKPFTITKEQYDKDIAQAKEDTKAEIIDIFDQDLLSEILYISSINGGTTRVIPNSGAKIVKGEIHLDLLFDEIKNLIK